MSNPWSDLHTYYKTQDWIDRQSLFAETAITYFPAKARVLELGAGQGQDSRFFAEHGHEVMSTDIEESALAQSKAKLSDAVKSRVTIENVDLRQELPFDNETFDVVYAHLSLHYFDLETTMRLMSEIYRLLKPGGVLAFLVNSVNDPEYDTGRKLEADYFLINNKPKRFFSLETVRPLTKYFNVNLLDDHGETYKDSAKGVHNLLRFIGTKRTEQT